MGWAVLLAQSAEKYQLEIFLYLCIYICVCVCACISLFGILKTRAVILTSLFSVGICTDKKDVPPVLHRKSQSCILQYAKKHTFLAVVTHNPQHHVSYIKTTESYLIFKDSMCKCGLNV